jgi:hypothetical protein
MVGKSQNILLMIGFRRSRFTFRVWTNLRETLGIYYEGDGFGGLLSCH